MTSFMLESLEDEVLLPPRPSVGEEEVEIIAAMAALALAAESSVQHGDIIQRQKLHCARTRTPRGLPLGR